MKTKRSACIGAALLVASLSSPALAEKPASSAQDLAAIVAARSHFFGAENVDQKTGAVDKEKVIFSWFSVQSYAVAARGHVFLLDSYIYRVSDTPAYVPTTVQELVDLDPEFIFLGHGHGDHSDNAAYIAVKTGAHIYGAAEHCDSMRGDAERIFGAGTSVDCTSLTTEGSAPGAEVSNIDAMRPDVCIVSFKHLHSGPAPLDADFPPNPINPVRDPRVNDLFPPQPPPTLDTRTRALNGAGPISMLYQFSVGNFSFLWHDTNGPIKDFAPQIIPMLASMPKVDVEFGSLVSTGETINGVRDIAMYIQLVKPKIFYGGHTDNFNIGASEYYHQALQRQFDIFGIPESDQPEVGGMHDPYDYLRPRLATFEWKNPRWREAPEGKNSVKCP